MSVDVVGVHAPMATGLPYGVSDGNVGGDDEETYSDACACGCGKTVYSEYEHYRVDEQLFYDEKCVFRHLGIEHLT